MMTDSTPGANAGTRRFLWVLLAIGAVLIATLLAAYWMNRELERARRIRDANAPAQNANPGNR